jgi:hypothetical protein
MADRLTNVGVPLPKAERIARRRAFVAGRCGLWVGDDGSLRRGRSGDVIQMMDDLRIPAVQP